jgi:hypothetical protein
MLERALERGLSFGRRYAERVRRNHGLEHATVAVLLARHGAQRIAGRASTDGFYLLCEADEATIQSCAEEALRRMQAGQRSLAVSPLCGTNIAVSAFCSSAAATLVLMGGRPRERYSNAFTAGMLGFIAGQPLGRWLQRRITTSGDVGSLELIGTSTVFGSLKKVQTREV